MEALLEKAKECGFDACGIVPVDVLSGRERGWSDGLDKDFQQE